MSSVQHSQQEQTGGGGTFAPLKVAPFRNIWSANLVSNLGHNIMGVAAAWEMTRLTGSPAMVAAVQTALFLPGMLVALPGGALADMFDRRKIALAGTIIAFVSATLLFLTGLAGLVTPWVLLALLFLVGSGVSMYGPAWASSIGELVPLKDLPAGIALGAVSNNLARSFGPAVGGVIVVAAGAYSAYGANAASYLPLIFALLLWRRIDVPNRLPPESFGRALVSGFRYARHAAPIRNAITRSVLFGLAVASTGGLAPLIARDMLGGGAGVYGIMLGASGIGAVAGSLSVSTIRSRFGPEKAVTIAVLVCSLAVLVIALSRSVPLTVAAYFVQGAMTLLCISMLNVGIQLSAPRWVMARALSLFVSALTGGLAIGALGFGVIANATSLEVSLACSALALFLLTFLGLLMPLTRESPADITKAEIGNEPDVAMDLTARSGPIVVEIEYRVAPGDAREFYQAMQPVGVSRRRNGGFDWSLARDIADPEMWTERYHCPTWGDYLHMRERYTQADRDAQSRVEAFNTLDGGARVRRRLERPYGSVRWRSETPDTGDVEIKVIAP